MTSAAYSKGQRDINYAVALISIYMHDYRDAAPAEKQCFVDKIKTELGKVQRVMQNFDYWMLCTHDRQRQLVELVKDVNTFLARA